MIFYSVRSRLALAKLMRAYNDLDVYVEDTSYVGVYERIINNVLAGKAHVTKVIPLGPRQNVIEAAINDNNSNERPRLYIVDSDLDLIAFRRRRTIPNLHRLGVYSLENLLFEETIVHAYCVFACPGSSASAILQSINFTKINHSINAIARKYILALAIARRLDIRDGSLSMRIPPLFRVINGKHVQVDYPNLRNRTAEVIATIKRHRGFAKYREAKEFVKATITYKNLSSVHYFPGKYLLWQLNEQIGHINGTSMKQKMIVSYLADHCSLQLDKTLVRRLRRVSRQDA